MLGHLRVEHRSRAVLVRDVLLGGHRRAEPLGAQVAQHDLVPEPLERPDDPRGDGVAEAPRVRVREHDESAHPQRPPLTSMEVPVT